MAIKEYRRAAGLTRKKFAEQSEIPLDVVKSWDAEGDIRLYGRKK